MTYTVVCIINGYGVLAKSYKRLKAAAAFAKTRKESGCYESVIIRSFCADGKPGTIYSV